MTKGFEEAVNKVIQGNVVDVLKELPAKNTRYEHLLGNKHAKGNPPNRTSFQKGHKTWNKGLKGIHLSPATEFKKGQTPVNLKAVGDMTIRRDKSGIKRRWIKIAEPSKWTEYAKYVWAQANGNIPKGLLIHHKDENALNDNLENLMLITRAAHINAHRKGLLRAKRQIKEFKERKQIRTVYKWPPIAV